MANRKITELNELFIVEDVDVFPIIDLSEGDLSLRNKKVSYATIKNSVLNEVPITPVTTKGDIFIYNSTQPDRLPVGTDGQILTANSFTTSGLEWVDPLGSPYFLTNAADGVPFIDPTSVDSIAIGEDVVIGANSFRSIAIGDRATIGDNAEGSVALGDFAEITTGREDAIAIGTFAYVRDNALYGIGIGRFSDVRGDKAIAIGSGCSAEQANSITIGTSTAGRAANSIVIGGGSGTSANSPNSILIGDGSGVFDNAYESVVIGGNNATRNNAFQSISLGYGSTVFENCNNSVSIGQISTIGSTGVVATGAISIGNSSNVSSNDGIAIGNNAQVATASTNAIQLGTGTNSTASTLQYLANTIATADGVKLPYQTTGVAPTSTPEDGTLVLDHNGGTTTLWARANGTWVSLISI